jgi:Fe-S oxidoreductase
MARMKIEALHQRRRKRGLAWKDRMIGHLPRFAPFAQRLRWLLHARDHLPGLAALGERGLGFSARRSLPRWHATPFRPQNTTGVSAAAGKDVVLFADTFTTWFEPENARSALRVLETAGYNVLHPETGGRPLCCGRTYLASGMVDEARAEARRLLDALTPFVKQGLPIIGLEPSCLFTLKDEFGVLLDDPHVSDLAEAAMLFESFLVKAKNAGELDLKLKAPPWKKALLHGHCHQKAFAVMDDVTACLGWIPDLAHEVIDSSCCGMAGAFGYQASHHAVSMQMAELSLLPAIRAAEPDTVVLADGTSCRHQIHDGSGRRALHVAQLLQAALA